MPILGWISDTFGRRTVLLFALFFGCISAFGQALAPTYLCLLLFRAFSGVWGGIMAAAQVYIGDVCPPAFIPQYMAYVSIMPSIARTIGPGIGGVLAVFGLQVPLLVDGSLSLVLWLAVL